MSDRYRINEPDVSAEVFDGEVLAINLKTGHYHSLRESGVAIWKLLAGGLTAEEIATKLAEAGSESPEQAEEVRTYVQHLVAAELVVPTDGQPPAEVDLAVDGGPYSTPVLESYTDMQELLLIDPIHEVDIQTGWPAKNAD